MRIIPMTNRVFSCWLLFSFAIIAANAQDQIKYNVISSVGSDIGMAVVVDGKPYPLSATTESSILHSGTAPVPHDAYYYAKRFKTNGTITEREPFERSPSIVRSTPNEFYNRTKNAYKIAELPKVFDPLPSIQRIKSDLHKPGQIATIHIAADQNEIDRMHKEATQDIKVKTNMTYISLDDVETLTDVELELAGRFSRQVTKLSYNIKIKKPSDLYGYRRLKLRALDTDPSYIREDLVYKIYESAGLPNSQYSFVRVFINDQPIGLFGFVEKFKNPWLRNEFNNGKKDDYVQGNLYQGIFMDAWTALAGKSSDLSYYGSDDVGPYTKGQYKISEDPSEGEPSWVPLVNLTRFIAEAPSTEPDAVETWKKHFDMDSVLRSMALEVVLGLGDAYVTLADNYYLYQEGGPQSERFIYLGSDFDLSFGSTQLVNLRDLETGDYKRFPGATDRPLLKQALRVPEFQSQFEQIIKDLVKKLVNLSVMNQTIEDTVAMIQEDVAWDMTLPRMGRLSFKYMDEALLGSTLGFMRGYPIDHHTIRDYKKRAKADIPFMTAVNGPTGYDSLAGVREFISIKAKAVAAFYGPSF